MEKRAEQIINHLIGTRLTYGSAVTKKEMGDMALFNYVIGRITVDPDTQKWKRFENDVR